MPRTRTTARTSCMMALVLISLAGSGLCPAQPDQRDTREPSKNVDDILRRFIAELVTITPGQGAFPESTPTENAALRPQESFRISRYETTQELYLAVMGSNPSRWKGPRNSVETVTRLDVDRFCSRLTALLRQRSLIGPNEEVRLPTDVEWEYSCRSGSPGPWCFGTQDQLDEQLDRFAWHTGNAAGNDPAVGVLEPNGFGLYDVHGYLWELVDVPAESDRNGRPLTWAMGGSWRDPAELLRADSRLPVPNYASSDAIGFRCVVAGAPGTSKNPPDR